MEEKINEIVKGMVSDILTNMLKEGDLLTPKGEQFVRCYLGEKAEEPETVKVVINGCFGGFGLSYEAVKELMKRKGMECYAYSQKLDGHHFNVDYTRTVSGKEVTFYFSKDLGERLSKDEMRKALKTDAHFDVRVERDDPDLVAVVEELGEKANGQLSRLYVVEVPSNVDWFIDEYDGNESIEENHRSWS